MPGQGCHIGTPGLARGAILDMHEVVWCGVVWYGVVWCGLVWYGVVCPSDGNRGLPESAPHESSGTFVWGDRQIIAVRV